MKKIVLSLLLIGFSQGKAAAPDFDFFCSQLLQKESVFTTYAARFTKEFQQTVPRESLKSIFFSLYGDTGSCVSFKALPLGKGNYRLILTGDKKIDVLFVAKFDEVAGLFSGLLVTGVDDPSFQVQSWGDVGVGLDKIDPRGQFSATIKTSDEVTNLSHKGSEVFAIGSSFKLYILGALEQSIRRGQHTWDEVLPIKEEWKSLPSGVMHTWPKGKQVKLYEYAEKMISISDNTATDHLLYFLGRQTIQNMLPLMGNTHHQLSAPFLSTLEMFKLKWAINPEETQNYIYQNEDRRLNILNSLISVPRSQVGTNGVSLEAPTMIRQIEWFATTFENCGAMFWLAQQNSPEVRSILSKNVPLIDLASPSSHWQFVGYKGGSEPGVLSMTYLLESKKGNRACLSVSWNNEHESVSKNRFMDIIGKLLKFAETRVP